MSNLMKDVNGDPSSKRLSGFVALGLIVILVFADLFGVDVNINIFYTLAGIVTGASITTLFERKS